MCPRSDTPRDPPPPPPHTLQPIGQKATTVKIHIMFVMSKSACTVGRTPRFAYCDWTKHHMSDCAKALPMFQKLRILNLNGNNLKDEGTELLASALKATWILCYWRSHPQPSQCITLGRVWHELVHDRRVLGWTGAFTSTVRFQVVLLSSRPRVLDEVVVCRSPFLWILITGSTWMCAVRRAPFF